MKLEVAKNLVVKIAVVKLDGALMYLGEKLLRLAKRLGEVVQE